MTMHRNAPTLVTAPTEEPVSLEEAKAHLREDSTDEDGLVSALISAAVGHMDGWSGILGRCMITQTWAESFDGFPSGYHGNKLRFRLSPNLDLAWIKYRDSANVEQTLSTTVYEGPFVDDVGPYVALRENQVWPSTYERYDAVTVQYTVGYGTAAQVPQAIRQAILLLVGHWYYSREAVVLSKTPTELPFAVSALLAPYRRVGF